MCGPFQCPCCVSFTLDARHDWDICPVCFWEDDVLETDPLNPSPSNHGLTLAEARANFRLIGACEPAMLEHVCPVPERAAFRYEPR